MADSTLFGNTAQPAWMAPEQRSRILQEEGLAAASSFNQAFQSAYSRQQQESIREKEIQKTKDELKPIIDNAKGLDSTAAWLKVNQEHPEYLLNPRTQPYWMELGKNLMGADTLKQKSLEGQQEIARVEKLNSWNDGLGILNQDEQTAIGQLAQNNPGRIDANGWLLVNGKPTQPSPQALSIVDAARKREGYAAFGMDRSERLSPTLSNIGKLQAERQRAVDSGAPPNVIKAYDDAITKANVTPLQVEEARQAGREKIENMRINARKALEDAKRDAALLGKDGKGVSEDEFVNRHFNKAFDGFYRDNQNETDPKKVRTSKDLMADADMSLRALYRASRPKATTKPADTTAPATDNADPLGIFK